MREVHAGAGAALLGEEGDDVCCAIPFWHIGIVAKSCGCCDKFSTRVISHVDKCSESLEIRDDSVIGAVDFS